MGVIERKLILLFFFLGMALFSFSENEPNNNFSQANEVEIGKEFVGKIQSRGDNDFYKFTVPNGGYLEIKITNISRDYIPELRLYDKNERYLKGASGQVTSMNMKKFVCEPGTYYIRFHAKRDRNYSQKEYTIVISAGVYDAYECNNTLETASTIGLNQKVVAAIQNEGDVDYYAIDLGESGILSLDLNKIPKSISTKVIFFNPSDSTIIHSDVIDSLSTSTIFKGRICKKGRYYVVIRDDDDKDFSFDQYEFELTLKKTDSYECNNTFEDATKIKIGETLKGFIDVKGDLDYYTFNNPDVGLVTVKVSAISAKIAPHLLVYNSDRELIKEVNGTTQLDDKVFLEFTACTGNEYYVVFKDKEGTAEDETNPYEIILSHETLEKYECNNTIETATTINAGGVIRANIRPAGDLDFYAIKLEKDVNYKLMVDLIPSSIDIVASVYEEGSNNPVFEVKKSKGDTIVKDFRVSKTGTFYLKLEDEGGDNFSTSDYFLLIKKDIITSADFSLSKGFNLSVYPNPGSDIINVSGSVVGDEILIADYTGKIVLVSHSKRINISNLEKGFYFVLLKSAAGRFVKY